MKISLNIELFFLICLIDAKNDCNVFFSVEIDENVQINRSSNSFNFSNAKKYAAVFFKNFLTIFRSSILSTIHSKKRIIIK